MKYYVDPHGQLYAYEADGSQDHLIPDSLTQITDADFQARTAPTEQDFQNIVRAERDMKLATEVDPISGNALRWASLTAEQQQAWADYRQALLDIPQQAGFPHDVVWPAKPEV